MKTVSQFVESITNPGVIVRAKKGNDYGHSYYMVTGYESGRDMLKGHGLAANKKPHPPSLSAPYSMHGDIHMDDVDPRDHHKLDSI